jgi:hypothetical protein
LNVYNHFPFLSGVTVAVLTTSPSASNLIVTDAGLKPSWSLPSTQVFSPEIDSIFSIGCSFLIAKPFTVPL